MALEQEQRFVPDSCPDSPRIFKSILVGFLCEVQETDPLAIEQKLEGMKNTAQRDSRREKSKISSLLLYCRVTR